MFVTTFDGTTLDLNSAYGKKRFDIMGTSENIPNREAIHHYHYHHYQGNFDSGIQIATYLTCNRIGKLFVYFTPSFILSNWKSLFY